MVYFSLIAAAILHIYLPRLPLTRAHVSDSVIDHIPAVVLKNQLYSLLSDHTLIDNQVNKLRCEGQLIMVKLDSKTYGLVNKQQYLTIGIFTINCFIVFLKRLILLRRYPGSVVISAEQPILLTRNSFADIGKCELFIKCFMFSLFY